MRKACKAAALALMICLPPMVWWQGLASPWIAALLFSAGVLHLIGGGAGLARMQALAAIVLALAIAAGARQLTLYYPVLINLMLLMLWFYSWWYPPTIIERLATIDDAAEPAKRRYMRRLTLAWCAVFAVNGSIALATTLLDDLTPWVVWNGFGAYLLVGVFAAGEYLLRKRLRGAVRHRSAT